MKQGWWDGTQYTSWLNKKWLFTYLSASNYVLFMSAHFYATLNYWCPFVSIYMQMTYNEHKLTEHLLDKWNFNREQKSEHAKYFLK